MNMEEQSLFLKALAKALAEHFGPQCEVAVHDLTRGYENTIIAIENGHVTGRHIGGDASGIVLRALKSKEDVKDSVGYLTGTQDGRLLKSSSIYMRDSEGRPTALFSINYDITALSHASSILGQFVNTARDEEQQDKIGTISSSVSELLDQLIAESVEHVGKPVALMNKDDKIKGIRYLEEKGAFLIKKSGDRVTKFYDISKYTLYNYMDSGSDA